MRILALDHGSARCGVAVSDPSGTLATPLETVAKPESEAGLRRIAALAAEWEVGRVIVGLPIGLSGADTAQTEAARAFAANLGSRLDVPVELHDERFTTKLAQRSGGRADEDARAAAHLLEGYLSTMSPP